MPIYIDSNVAGQLGNMIMRQRESALNYDTANKDRVEDARQFDVGAGLREKEIAQAKHDTDTRYKGIVYDADSRAEAQRDVANTNLKGQMYVTDAQTASEAARLAQQQKQFDIERAYSHEAPALASALEQEAAAFDAGVAKWAADNPQLAAGKTEEQLYNDFGTSTPEGQALVKRQTELFNRTGRLREVLRLPVKNPNKVRSSAAAGETDAQIVSENGVSTGVMQDPDSGEYKGITPDGAPIAQDGSNAVVFTPAAIRRMTMDAYKDLGGQDVGAATRRLVQVQGRTGSQRPQEPTQFSAYQNTEVPQGGSAVQQGSGQGIVTESPLMLTPAEREKQSSRQTYKDQFGGSDNAFLGSWRRHMGLQANSRAANQNFRDGPLASEALGPKDNVTLNEQDAAIAANAYRTLRSDPTLSDEASRTLSNSSLLAAEGLNGGTTEASQEAATAFKEARDSGEVEMKRLARDAKGFIQYDESGQPKYERQTFPNTVQGKADAVLYQHIGDNHSDKYFAENDALHDRLRTDVKKATGIDINTKDGVMKVVKRALKGNARNIAEAAGVSTTELDQMTPQELDRVVRTAMYKYADPGLVRRLWRGVKDATARTFESPAMLIPGWYTDRGGFGQSSPMHDSDVYNPANPLNFSVENEIRAMNDGLARDKAARDAAAREAAALEQAQRKQAAQETIEMLRGLREGY